MGVDWIHLTQERNTWLAVVENNNETSGFIKRGEFLD